jgi:magnesium chelatase family protein
VLSGLASSFRAIRGVLPAVLAAAAPGHTQVVVPAADAEEAALVDSVEVLPARSPRSSITWPGGRTPGGRGGSGG